MQHRNVFILILLLCSCSVAQAKLLHTIEAGLRAAARRQLGLLQTQIGLFEKHLSTLMQVADLNEKMLGSLEQNLRGHYGYGAYLNDVNAQAERRWAPSDTADLLAAKSAHEQYQQTHAYYDKHYQDSHRRDGLYEHGYQDEQAHSKASFVYAGSTYNQLDQRILQVEGLMKEIDKAENLKAALDLNNRLQAENAMLHIAGLRLQSVNLLGQARVQKTVVDSKTLSKEFNQWEQSDALH